MMFNRFLKRKKKQRYHSRRNSAKSDALPSGILEPLEPRLLLSGTNIIVDSLQDVVAPDGFTTLREAIQAANTNLAVNEAPAGNNSEVDVITFNQAALLLEANGAPLTITLSGTELAITESLTLTGLGVDILTLDANQLSRVLNISGQSTQVGLSNLTLTGGSTIENGAGILNDATLNIANVSIVANQSVDTGDGAGNGAGIYNTGALTVTHSTITANTATDGAGGGVTNTGTATFLNSIIVSNLATSTGGGIYNSNGVLHITNSTIISNRSLFGGGIRTLLDGATNLNNTIVTQNIGANGSNVLGHLTGQNNLIGFDVDFVTNPTPGDDGLWFTIDDTPGDYHLLETSPAINRGDNALAVDADSNPISLDLDANTRIADTTVDIGAYEFQGVLAPTREPLSATADTLADTTDSTDGLTSLREAIAYSHLLNQNIILDPALANGTITLTGQQLSIHHSLDIDASPIGHLTIDANGQSRVLLISGDANVNLTQLTLTGGASGRGAALYSTIATTTINDSNITTNNATATGGGFNIANATLTINDSTIWNNTAQNGGGIYSTASTLIINDSVITDNAATQYGGGLSNIRSLSTLNNTTVSGNNARYGGGIRNIGANGLLTLSNSTITANNANSNGGGLFNTTAAIINNSSIISNNTAPNGAGIRNAGSAATLTIDNSTITANTANSSGGGISNANDANLALINSTLSGNTASNQGGGGIYNTAIASAINTTFELNVANNGGAIHTIGSSDSFTLTNSIILANTANSEGGGIYTNGSTNTLTINNSTITSNTATLSGGGVSQGTALTTLNNTIIALNNAPTDPDIEAGFLGSNNIISFDPQFTRNPDDGADGWADDPATGGIDESANNDLGDLHPSAFSFAINAGENSLLPSDLFDLNNNGNTLEPLPNDIDGKARIIHGTVDAGAYESEFEEALTGDIDVELPIVSDNVHAFDFGTIEIGQASSQIFTLRNEGLAPLTITQASGLDAPFSINPSNHVVSFDDWTLQPGATQDFTVFFTPTSSNSFMDTLTLISDDPDEPTYPIILEGVVRPPLTSTHYMVDTLVDVVANDGLLSLREAIEAANTNAPYFDAAPGSDIEADLITFAPSLFASGAASLILNGTRLNILDSLHIQGPDAELFTINADNRSNAFWVFGSGNNVLMDGFTITGGNNTAGGGGVYNSGSTLQLTSMVITGNTASYGAGIKNQNADLIIVNSQISNNTAENSEGGGISTNNGTVTLTNSTIADNHSGHYGGGISSFISDLTLLNSIVTNNTAVTAGGGIYANNTSNLTVINSKIIGNASENSGGGIASYSDFDVTNSVVVGNTAGGLGGGIFAASNINLTNSTVVANNALSGGGGLILFTGPTGVQTLNNSIIALNTSPVLADVHGTFTGANNLINTNPLFVRNPFVGIDNMWGTPDDDYGDLHLSSANSSAVDAGSNGWLPLDTQDLDDDYDTFETLPVDLDGAARIFNGTVDAGAYESEFSPIESGDIDVELPGIPDNVHAFDFGIMEINQNASQIFTLRNEGAGPLTIFQTSGLAAPFSINPINDATSSDDWAIQPGATQQFIITFAPTAADTFSDTLTLASDDPYEPTYQITLHGVAANPPGDIDVELPGRPDDVHAYYFGTIDVGQNASQIFTLRNEGQSPLIITHASGLSAPFTINPVNNAISSDDWTIQPSATQQFTVTFAPTTATTFNGTLTLLSDDLDEPAYQISLQGVATNPPGDIDVELPGQHDDVHAYDFGTLDINQNASQIFTLRNEGLGALIVTQASGLTAPFTINPINGLTSADDWTIQPGATQQFTITFAPTSADTFNSTFTLESDDPDEPAYEIDLQGAATSPPGDIDVELPTIPDNVHSFNFGTTEINQNASQIFTLHNEGLGVLTISQASDLTAPFTINPINDATSADDWTLQPGATQQFTITFAPTVIDTFYSTLTLTSDDPDEPAYSITLQGAAAILQPDIDVESSDSPSDLFWHFFGTVPVGSIASEIFTVHNKGNGLLRISQATGLTAPFSIDPINGGASDDDWVIQPGATQQFTVSFAPTFEEGFDATLNLTSNDPDESIYQILFVGIAPTNTHYVVNSLLDVVASDGLVTLREAIQAANTNTAVFDAEAGGPLGQDRITFDPALFASGPATLTLGGTDLDITDSLSIEGPGEDLLTISGDGRSSIFYVSGDSLETSISHMTLANGRAYGAGAITNYYSSPYSTLNLDHVTLKNNFSTSSGGAIVSYGTLNISNSTIIGNTAYSNNSGTTRGGGVVSSGGVFTLFNSTVVGNSAKGDLANGGGIHLSSGELVMTNSTVVNNYAEVYGGGISAAYGSTVTLNNSILSFNESLSDTQFYLSKNNASINSTLLNTDPGFVRNPSPGPDGNWGTADDDYGDLRLTSSSHAINLGDSTLAVDNHGAPLSQDQSGALRITHNQVDIGSYEYQGPVSNSWESPSTLVTTLLDVDNKTDGVTSIREAMYHAIQLNQDVTFDSQLSGGVITLANRDLTILQSIHINASSLESITLDAASQSRVFDISGVQTQATLTGLTITGGYAEFDGGGIMVRDSQITLNDSVVTANAAAGRYDLSNANEGGGIYSSFGSVTLNNTVVSNNSAYYGGGIEIKSGTLTINDSNISNNTSINSGGGINGFGSIVTINNTLIANNSSTNTVNPSFSKGGGIYISSNDYVGILTITNSTITGNSAVNGGGIYHGNRAIIINSKIHSNTAELGGGIYQGRTALEIINSTLVANSANRGGGIYSNLGLTLTNSTITSNDANSGGGIYGFVFQGENGIITLQNSIVTLNQNADNISGQFTAHNSLVGVNPLFVRNPSPGPDATWGTPDDDHGDLLLQPISSGVDTGDNTLLPADTYDLDNDNDTTEPLPIDLAGKERIFDGMVDIGAYEWQLATLEPGEIDVERPGVPDNVHAYDFGTINVGQQPSATFTLRNEGDTPLTINEVTGLSNNFTLSPTNGSSGADDWTLQPASTRQFTVTFNAIDSIPINETLILHSNDIDEPTYPIVLSGLVNRPATHYVVNTLADTVAQDGLVSLREAIEAANTNTQINTDVTAGSLIETDVITFNQVALAAEAGVAFGQPVTITLNGTQLDINDQLSIHGIGQNLLAIDANGQSRVFNITGADTNVSIDNLTIKGGSTSGTGAGIYLVDATLSLFNTAITDNNTSNAGGGIFNREGFLNIYNSNISSNSSYSGGGGIYNHIGALTITQSTISNNVAASGTYGAGAGINSYGSTLEVTHTTLSDNDANNYGGGIYIETVSSGSPQSTALTNVTLTNNNAYYRGGGIFISTHETHTPQGVSITQGQLIGNTSRYSGAAVYNENDTVTLTNTLITANYSNYDTSGVSNDGTMTINNSTIAGNISNTNGAGLINYGNLTINNSIVAMNVNQEIESPDNFADLGTTISNNNFIADFPGFVRNPAPGPDNLWGTPDDDRGDLHLLATSPTLNNGDNSLLPVDAFDIDNDLDTTEPLPIDLDGNARIINTTVDLGVYESSDTPVAPGEIDIESASQTDDVHTVDFGSLYLGESTQQTLTIRNEGIGMLLVSEATALNAPFSMTPVNGNTGVDDWVIQPGGTQDILLTFAPTTEAIFESTLTLVSNDINEPTYEINLTAQGLTHAANYVVDSLLDVVATDGVVTLREALEAANTNTAVTGDVILGSGTETDTITFAPALFAAGPATITLLGTQLEISDTLNLQGPGPDLLTIDANNQSRVLLSNPDFLPIFPIDISGLTITGGTNDEALIGGAGILLNKTRATLTNLLVTNNTTTSSQTDGAGIANRYGELTLIDSVITNNHAHGDDSGGAGISSTGTAEAFTTLINTMVTNNTAQYGAGIVHGFHAKLNIIDSMISNNAAISFGGGIYDQSDNTTTIINSTISNNTVQLYRGGGIAKLFGELNVINSTVTRNRAELSGGGVYLYNGVATITNTVIAGNYTSGEGGGIHNFTGSNGSTMAINNSTIAGNYADIGGGVFNADNATLTLNNTLVLKNDARLSTNIGGLFYTNNSHTSIIFDPAFIRNPTPGPDSIWGTPDDDLGDLHLRSNSPAINAGNNTLLPLDTADLDNDSNSTESLPLDLDAKPRVNGGTVDIGAYETQFFHPADFNADESIDIVDADTLSAAINTSSPFYHFDLNDDGAINSQDGQYLIQNILNSFPADFNLDYQVDVADLSTWATGFGKTSALFSQGDSNFDGQVDVADLSIWATNFGNSSTPPAPITVPLTQSSNAISDTFILDTTSPTSSINPTSSPTQADRWNNITSLISLNSNKLNNRPARILDIIKSVNTLI